MKTWLSRRKKNKVQMQTKMKIIYLNADFCLADLNYFDLKQMHPFYRKLFATTLLQFFFSIDALD